MWAADTGGARDSGSSPIRAQRGVWKKLFEQVSTEDGNAHGEEQACVSLSCGVDHRLIGSRCCCCLLPLRLLSAAVLRQLEIDYAGNIAGGEPRMVRSLCYDMGHVFDDEEELASCIADMRAIGEGSVTEVISVGSRPC
jgi:hypothetical protein